MTLLWLEDRKDLSSGEYTGHAILRESYQALWKFIWMIIKGKGSPVTVTYELQPISRCPGPRELANNASWPTLQLLLHPKIGPSDHTAGELVEGRPQETVLGKLVVFDIQKSETEKAGTVFHRNWDKYSAQ